MSLRHANALRRLTANAPLRTWGKLWLVSSNDLRQSMLISYFSPWIPFHSIQSTHVVHRPSSDLCMHNQSTGFLLPTVGS